jgi:hypothetical protein
LQSIENFAGGKTGARDKCSAPVTEAIQKDRRSKMTLTESLPTAVRDEDLIVLKTIFPTGRFRLFTPNEWAAATDGERAALIRAGVFTDAQFNECLNVESETLKAACADYLAAQQRYAGQTRRYSALMLSQKLVEGLRLELLALALEALADLPVEAVSSLGALLDAIAAARPEWGITGSTTIDIVWKLLERGARQRYAPNKRAGAAKKPRRPLPRELSQWTFQEVRDASIAIADGARLRRWYEIPGETALRHIIEGEPFQVKLTIGPWQAWLGDATSHEDLRRALQTFTTQGALLLQLAVGLALQERHATLEIDDLIRLMGWQPRSTNERAEMRQTIYRWLSLLDSMAVIGKRRQEYTDKLTNERLDLTCTSALVRITEVRSVTQQTGLSHGETPVSVTLTAGPFLDKLRGNKQVLQHFGNVQKLAELPAGKPSGAWALSIGLALNQLWRQGAKTAQINNAGDSNRKTVSFRFPFTRYRLLDMFRAEPWVENVLTSANPKRAQKYWCEAISLLQQQGVVGDYAELDKLPQGHKGWQHYWLHQQRLDIRPTGDAVEAVVELSRSVIRAKKRGPAKKRKAGAAKDARFEAR